MKSTVRTLTVRLICVCGLLFLTGNALSYVAGQSRPIAIFRISPITRQRKDLDTWPKILDARSSAVDRANKIISDMNQSTSDALRECDDDYCQYMNLPESARVKGSWDRKIKVVMRGPRFIAMVAEETAVCSGSYHNNDHVAVVFDMNTGDLVRWTDFLSAGTEATTGVGMRSIDGAISPGLMMPALTKLALKDAEGDAECANALKSIGELNFQVWPDAKRGQLMAKATGLPHVVQGCEEEIGVPIEEARALGFSDDILRAIQQAHQLIPHSPRK